MVSPITMVSAAKYAPMASWDVPCDQFRKRRGPDFLMALHVIQAPSRSGQLEHSNPFLGQS